MFDLFQVFVLMIFLVRIMSDYGTAAQGSDPHAVAEAKSALPPKRTNSRRFDLSALWPIVLQNYFRDQTKQY
jgi:hypothetical protein